MSCIKNNPKVEFRFDSCPNINRKQMHHLNSLLCGLSLQGIVTHTVYYLPKIEDMIFLNQQDLVSKSFSTLTNGCIKTLFFLNRKSDVFQGSFLDIEQKIKLQNDFL